MIKNINFENSYLGLPGKFYEKSLPSAGETPELMAFNRELAQELSLELGEASKGELAQIFSGKKKLEGSEPIATAYCGHQFGHFNPSLGDGRAHLLGEVVNKNGGRFDIQLKGSGRTRFSRRGDGLSWIGPVIREYIVSEAMYALGVPTTRALAAVRSGESVLREDELPGGIFTRVASSHIRVGTFEFASAHGNEADLKALADYTINRHYPDLADKEEKYHSFLLEVSKRKLSLVAKWMGVGFIHGVMNTDNTSVAGITIDYGPCAFMDKFSANKVFSSIDRQGRYAYGNQGPIALWNLSVLANALFPILGVKVERLQEDFKELESYYRQEYLKVMASKLGIVNPEAQDLKLIEAFLAQLEEERLDFTNSFRKLVELEWPQKEFEQRWLKRLEGREQEAAELMKKSNPWIIPRNHQVQKAIDASLEGDDAYFVRLSESFRNPFVEIDELIDLVSEPQPEEIVHQTFCGT